MEKKITKIWEIITWVTGFIGMGCLVILLGYGVGTGVLEDVIKNLYPVLCIADVILLIICMVSVFMITRVLDTVQLALYKFGLRINVICCIVVSILCVISASL